MGVEQIILIVHVLAAIGIIALILIQQGKGADAGASFGAGASQTVFGSSGSGNFLTKSTAALAALFFVTSFGLAIIAKDKANVEAGSNLPSMEAVESQAADTEVPVFDDAPALGNEDVPVIDAAGDVPAANDANGS